MNQVHQKRLLNVAKALRESAAPEFFSMCTFGWGPGDSSQIGDRSFDIPSEKTCGTPACALGHYAARKDLQRLVELDLNGRLKLRRTGTVVGIDSMTVQSHFGVTDNEMDDLFSATGCNHAKGVKAAALFIERFVARKAKEA